MNNQRQVKYRSPIAVVVLSIITLGIYSWYWSVKTKGELNRSGCDHIPTAWIWLIPFAIYYWMWKYSVAAEQYTNRQLSAGLNFVLMALLGSLGSGIIQNYLNIAGASEQPNSANIGSNPFRS